MSEETREEIVSELRAYKIANPNWVADVEMAKVVASFNNRLAPMSPPGNHPRPVNFIEIFPSVSQLSLTISPKTFCHTSHLVFPTLTHSLTHSSNSLIYTQSHLVITITPFSHSYSLEPKTLNHSYSFYHFILYNFFIMLCPALP